MMASSTTRPKLDRTIQKQTIKETKEPEIKPAPSRKISTFASLNQAFLRPRVSSINKRERKISASSRDHDRYSTSSQENSHRSVKLENTYQLKPSVQFQEEKIQGIIQDVFESELRDMEYDPITSAKTCLSLSTLIKEKVKMLNMKRYKIICAIVITEQANQSLTMASRFCWDKDNDNFASATYSQPNLHAVGTVFGVYLD